MMQTSDICIVENTKSIHINTLIISAKRKKNVTTKYEIPFPYMFKLACRMNKK